MNGGVVISRGALLFWAWLLYCDDGGFFPQCLLACILHEIGHIVVLRFFQNDIKLIRITMHGAQIICDGTMSYGREIAAAAAGPCVNFILAIVCCKYPAAWKFAGINFLLGVLNMLPIGPLDGARILWGTVSLLFDHKVTDRLIWCLGFGFTATLLAAGVIIAYRLGNPTLLVAFLWLAYGFIREKRLEK